MMQIVYVRNYYAYIIIVLFIYESLFKLLFTENLSSHESWYYVFI